jgi:FMN phosphatase YigB (HAD superfamily)
METIRGVLFEPVGCLAEFPAEPFHEIAVRLFGRKGKPSRSGSRSYWHLLNLMQAAGGGSIEALEVEAAAGASVYDDVMPALSQLKAIGIQLFIASSLSNAAVARWLKKCPYDFDAVWSRDTAGGIKAKPLTRAIEGASLPAKQVMFLTDTAEGLKVSKSLGIPSVLMMNDPDEAKRLALQDPAGGIVSLHELPDFIRLVRFT